MLIGIALFLAGFLAGHFELPYRALQAGSAIVDWALRYDATGRRGLLWRTVVAPIMIFALFLSHPVQGGWGYLRAKWQKHRST
ncbi:hypothetical protein [Streptomyces sp. IBSBF 2950]|uniref:hypothetical protein n=1 Tax=Streptomyces sp. IBSBF 2950 TaxID=2903528 RepID=UPI002FDBDFA0